MKRALALLVVLAGCGGATQPAAPLQVSVARGGLTDEVATAVPIGRDRVLTVAHVLDAARSVRVAGRPARVLRVDTRLDLALVQVRGLDAPALEFATAGGRAELHVLRGGRPHGLAVRIRRRVTAELRDTRTGTDYVRPTLEIATRVLPGDSGAPLTDDDGRVVGIVFAQGRASAWAVDVSKISLVG